MGEDSRWEFKQIAFRGDRPISPKRDSLANELAAFANGHGGVLLFGVTDAREVQGMTREQLDAAEQLIFQICADSIIPAIEIDVRRFEIDDKALLSIAVPAGYTLHDSPGGPYRRVGSSARKMTRDERLRLAQQHRGKDRASGQLDAQEITGPLNQQVADAAAFAVRNMRVVARKEPARVDMPQYSERALFEALVNAVAHRDYSMRDSKVRLSMFEDRLEIQSPGALPNNLTVESMATRQATRNQILTSVLGRMPVGGARGSDERRYFMERRGDGVPIILRETRALCGRSPEYRLIGEAEVCLIIPAALQEQSPARVVVTVRCAGEPLGNVDLLALFPNNTWKRAETDECGEAILDLHSTHLPMTVFAAATGFAACVQRDWTPAERPLSLELNAVPPGGGAVVFPESTGDLPGLEGRLNPILDALDRTYLYASNIAINQGQPQPVHFLLGEDLRLTDADGNELWARVVAMAGRSALVEYHPFNGE